MRAKSEEKQTLLVRNSPLVQTSVGGGEAGGCLVGSRSCLETCLLGICRANLEVLWLGLPEIKTRDEDDSRNFLVVGCQCRCT